MSLTWGCERFSDYLIGKQFHVETDHKVVQPLANRSTGDYKIYDVGLGLAERFLQRQGRTKS